MATPSVAAFRAGDGATAATHGRERHDGGHERQSESGDPREPPRGGRRVQVPTGWAGGEEKDSQTRRHGRCRYPVVARHPAGPDHRHVGEHEEQLGGEDGLDEGEVAVMQRSDLKDEPQDHAGDTGQPDRLAHEVEEQTGAETLTPGGGGGPQTLAHRGSGRAEARGQRQHHRPHHEPSPWAIDVPVRSPPRCMLFARGIAGVSGSAGVDNRPWASPARRVAARRWQVSRAPRGAILS